MNVEQAIRQASKVVGLTLKPKQLEAVVNFCNGKDVFVSFPTGYGKSIVYGILPLVFDKIRGN